MPVFVYEKDIEVSDNILERINGLLLSKKEFSKISNTPENTEDITISYIIIDNIANYKEPDSLMLSITIKNKKVISHTKIETISESTDVTEFHLQWYVNNLLIEILTDDRQQKKSTYTVRNYIRYFNASSIKTDIAVNTGIKTIIYSTKGNFPDGNENLTEHIIIYDSSIDAVNHTHARSIGYNNSLDLNSYMAVLLDVGFEMVYSDNRIFIENENGSFNPRRKRTGFYDVETGLKVIDNMNGLFLSDTIPFPTNIMSILDEESKVNKIKESLFFRDTNSDDIENVFSKIKITKPTRSDLAANEFKTNKHFSNTEIIFPSITNDYFNGIRKLNVEKKRAFTACARIYNMALLVERLSLTASAAYLVCAIECLGNYHQLKFSPFLKSYAPDEFDKNLTDFFYGKIRSGHFHAGNFLFGEFSISLAAEIDLLLTDRSNTYYKFHNTIRSTLINWINRELIVTP